MQSANFFYFLLLLSSHLLVNSPLPTLNVRWMHINERSIHSCSQEEPPGSFFTFDVIYIISFDELFDAFLDILILILIFRGGLGNSVLQMTTEVPCEITGKLHTNKIQLWNPNTERGRRANRTPLCNLELYNSGSSEKTLSCIEN